MVCFWAKSSCFNLPLSSNSPSSQFAKVSDSPPAINFFESFVLHELSQIQKDIDEIFKYCLVGKMLGAPLNTRTIAKTMANQKSLKRDVDYIEMHG